jgi:hypothetical protein
MGKIKRLGRSNVAKSRDHVVGAALGCVKRGMGGIHRDPRGDASKHRRLRSRILCGQAGHGFEDRGVISHHQVIPAAYRLAGHRRGQVDTQQHAANRRGAIAGQQPHVVPALGQFERGDLLEGGADIADGGGRSRLAARGSSRLLCHIVGLSAPIESKQPPGDARIMHRRIPDRPMRETPRGFARSPGRACRCRCPFSPRDRPGRPASSSWSRTPRRRPAGR